jgi:phage baseplate assembly protein W
MVTPNPAKAFLGVGWAFPPRVAKDGATAMSAYEQDIKESLRIILGTERGERLMRADFGAGLRSFVFGVLSQTTLQQIQTRVRESLVKWEPRIDVEQVSTTIDPTERSVLLIEITYRVRATNTRDNLVYPFYLEEGSAA